MNLTHIYHLYADGQYETPVDEHAQALLEHGLYEKLDRFYVGLVGTDENRASALERLRSHGLDPEVAIEAPIAWEQVTLEWLRRYTTTNDGATLYAHTKGAYNPTPINEAWRKSMTYYNVVDWQPMVAALDEYETAGCHWIVEEVNRFYGGNYWWARNNYLRRLAYPTVVNRWHAEIWIGTRQPNAYDANPGFPAESLFRTTW